MCVCVCVCVCVCFVVGREAGRCAMVCMYVNKKRLYCEGNVVRIKLE